MYMLQLHSFYPNNVQANECPAAGRLLKLHNIVHEHGVGMTLGLVGLPSVPWRTALEAICY